MDIHRCRFVEFPPAAINALSFSHASGAIGRQNPLRLAVGRANGNIEIWDPRNGAWLHETTIQGGKDRSVEGLAWIQEPDTTNGDGYTVHGKLRLFSIGYSSNVTEWNLITGLPLRQSSGSHSEVWCLAAQPRQSKNELEHESGGKGQSIVAGCADGTLILLSTADDSLDFQKVIARPSKKSARALSIAFQNRYTVGVGFADSTIRVYDIRNGKLIRAMSLGAGPQKGPKEILVWAIECLKDQTIVSADSTGQICFWDAKTYGQLQRIKGHEADALCLAASEDGLTVLSGGMDRRTVAYALAAHSGERKRWIKTAHRRFHKHDIKAMARFENKRMSVVVSGGLDTQPVITPLREFRNEFHRTLPYNPQKPPVTSAGRLLVSWWMNEVNIWAIAQRDSRSEDVNFLDQATNYRLISRMLLKNEEHISCASISPEGSLVVVGTSSEVRVFQLRKRTGSRQHELKSKKLELPMKLSKTGVRRVEISPNSCWMLLITLENKVVLHQITANKDEEIKFGNAIPLTRQEHKDRSQNPMNGEWGSYDRIINQATFSWDSQIITTSDLCGFIDTWILRKTEDTKTQISSDNSDDSNSDSDSASESELKLSSHLNGASETTHDMQWRHISKDLALPQLSTYALVLSFRPTTHSSLSASSSENLEHKLLVVTATHELYEYSVLHGRLTDWSRRNPPTTLPEDFKKQKERAMGCFWDICTSRERIWLYGATWICMFDLRQDFPSLSSSSSVPSDLINGAPSENASGKGDVVALQNGQKRKRGKSVFPASSGAGDRIPDEEVRSGLMNRLIKKLDPDGGEGEWIDLEEIRRAQAQAAAASEDVDMGEDNDDEGGNDDRMDISELHRLRKSNALLEKQQQQQDLKNDVSDIEMSNTEAGRAANAQSNCEDELASSSSALVKKEGTQQRPPRAFYITNKYRPILGIVPLSSPSLPSWQTATRPEKQKSDAATHKHEASQMHVHATALTNGISTDEKMHETEHDNSDLDDDNNNDHRDDDKKEPIGANAEEEEGRGEGNEEERYPEVALIERPFWDLDLPPRFVGDREWERY